MALNLVKKQQEIVEFKEGALLVKAGPGSGKTRVLIERIKKLLIGKKRCKILALTFSNLAAEEMKQRLEEDEAVQDLIENVNVGTIHSFALDIVQRRGNLVGLREGITLFESNTDRQKILREVFLNDHEFNRILRKQERPDKFLGECLERIADQKKQFITPDMYSGDVVFKKLYEEYNQFLLEQNAIDFDDILFYAYNILVENPSIQKMYSSLYKYICVDEAQDLNFAQYELIKAICSVNIKNIMFVGDANQSIYGFNGSNSDLMTKKFVEDFNPCIYELNENFRSSKKIVEYANRLENTESVSNYYYEGELNVIECGDENVESDYVLQRIIELAHNGHPDIESVPDFDDFAVIARNRYALNKIEEKLSENNIPYFYKKTINGIQYESEYIKVFDLALRIYLNKRDLVHMNELCSLLECDGKQNLTLQSTLGNTKFKSINEALTYMSDDNFNFIKGINIIKRFIEESKGDFEEDEKYLILKDIEEWKRHWKKYASTVASENRSLLSFRNSISLGKTQDISVDKGVALLTVHMSKGLQYEVVFVVGLSEGTFPDYRALKAGSREMEQEKNNMFVAATRAKRLCYFTFPKYKKMPWGDLKLQHKSRFLFDIPVEKLI